MKKLLILAVVLIIAISISACGKKAPVEEPQQMEEPQLEEEYQETEEPAEEDIEASVPETQENPNSDEKEITEESASTGDIAYKIPDFVSTDFDGNEITNQFFADNKLTVVNIWTTT